SHLERRIGGVRAGSGSYIWTIKTAGLRALKQAGENLPISRKNKYEPTSHHLEHTLAITEIYVQLTEIARKNPNFTLDLFLFEPTCWRGWLDALGGQMRLKPDSFAEISLHDYVDSYFIEVDKSTESLNRIVNKCKQYIRYYNTGFEQKHNNVFPLVLWIAPDEKRKIAIQKRIQDELANFWELFQVVSLDEFAEFVAGGIDDGK
ncbi:replication-relaxation family protein, partial [Pseudolactococcus hodotermopsidis]|uniref:replication-relaxation family protein n=1 Tax=Pseudolactococcus hodotermopsidis TaxID=2709157 RepID=UPI001555AE3E